VKFKVTLHKQVHYRGPYSIKVTVCHTVGHYDEEYDDWNSDVFRSRRNFSSDDSERTDGGRAFHARAAATGKARSPSVVRRVDGATSVDVEAPRRRRREPTSAVRWRVSARYDGAVPLRKRHARTHNRNWILSGTFSQYSSRRSGGLYVLRLPRREHETSGGVKDRLQPLWQLSGDTRESWVAVVHLRDHKGVH